MGLATGSAADARPEANQYFDLTFHHLRVNKSAQGKRFQEFLEAHHLPMTRRNEFGAVGYLQVHLSPDMPTLVTVVAYRSWADVAEKRAKQQADKQWTRALGAFGADEPGYVREETWLLRAFDGMPRLETPALEPGKKARLFDLRTYEAETWQDVVAKVEMFNQEEIQIFRRCGIYPVFFGQSLYGSKQPNLTYMVWYDDMRAREAAWTTFLKDPDWVRIRGRPGWTNEEVVSNISNTFLQPLSFSPIR